METKQEHGPEPSTTVKFEPPPHGGGGPRNVGMRVQHTIDTELKPNAGSWAVVLESADKTRLSNHAQAWRRRGCQVTVQGGKLYARWLDD